MKRPPRDLTELHREQLVDIGRILQATREAQGTTHEDIAATTLIRPSLLKAMEAAEVTQLPEPVYTRGLIRQYANVLGLDGETLSSQYFTPPVEEPQRSFWRVPITPQLRPLHLYVLYVLIIVASVSGLSYTLKRASYRTSTLPPLTGEGFEEATEPTEDAPTAAEGDSGQSVAPEVANAPVRVAVEMQDQSWLRITTDGEVTFEGVLKEGDTRTWTADEQVVIRAGNAGGVVVSFNEGAAESLGQPGVVTEVAFPPNETAAWLP
jgi:cytoskeletal protein RodZ